ncbi:MAG: glycosyltransferase family 2 protein, partial [Chitinivibrionales bacterium]|nr:glycosyltransferase family 2 protein [Chitinivibrionales bacterium]
MIVGQKQPSEQTPVLSVVVPCYNEEPGLEATAKVLGALVTRLIGESRAGKESHICFVDDGSEDKTWVMIEALCKENKIFRGIKLSRNFGHQYAILSGMEAEKNRVDCVVTMDADLQDDPEAIVKFLEYYRQGCEIVYGVRKKREYDSVFKRTSAYGFYKIIRFLGINMVYNHADYRLIGRKALEALTGYN